MINENNETKLYKSGAICLYIIIVYAIATMILMPTIGLPPETAEECFNMLKANKLIGLLRLNILTVLIMPLYYVIYLAVYLSLKKITHATISLYTLLMFARSHFVSCNPICASANFIKR